MKISINLPQDLEQDLIRQAAQSNIPLQTLIIQTLRQLTPISINPPAQWSETVSSFSGIPNFPALESYREELLPTHKPIGDHCPNSHIGVSNHEH